MAVIIDGSAGITTPGVTDTGNLSVAGSTTLTTPLPVASGGTGASSLSGITTGTSTNLAGGSNGTIPYQSAAGTTQMLAVGTSGQVLQTNGAGAPSWTTPSSGALVYISQVAASGASTVDIENAFTAYDKYVIIASGIEVPSGTDLYLVTKHGGSYQSSGYLQGRFVTNMSSAFQINSSTNGSEITCYGNGFSSGNSLTFTCELSKPSSSSFPQIISVQGVAVSSATGVRYFNTCATWTYNQALQGVRFFGATFTGTFRLYGIANS
jgi:hypothetical protein